MIDITVRAELYCFWSRDDGCPDKHWRHEPLVVERLTRKDALAAITALGWAIDDDEGVAICPACLAAGRTSVMARAESIDFNLAHDATIAAIQADRPRCKHGKALAPQAARNALAAGHVAKGQLFPNLVCWECEA